MQALFDKMERTITSAEKHRTILSSYNSMKAQVGKLGKALSNVQVLYYSLLTCLTVTVQLQGCGVIAAARSQITPQMRDRPQSSGAGVTRDTAGPPCCMMDAVWMWYGCGWSLHTYPTPHQPWYCATMPHVTRWAVVSITNMINLKCYCPKLLTFSKHLSIAFIS